MASKANESAAQILRGATQVLGNGSKGQSAEIDKGSLENTFAKLNKVTENRKTARRMARNKDAIHGLLTTLNQNPKFSKMVEYSVQCFKNMAVDEVCIEELIEEGVLETLLKVQRLNPYNENITRMINEAIAAFCINDRIAKMISDRIGSANFMFSLRKHQEPETVASTCNAMAKMMQHTDNIHMFVKADIIPGLEHVASGMNQEPEVMASVAECLRYISQLPEYVPMIMSSSIMPNLLLALKSFPDNSHLVERTFALIANICAAGGEYVEMLQKMGAVDLIVAALEANPNNAAILKLGAVTLRSLASDFDLTNALRVRIGMTDETANALAKLSSLMLVEENIDKMIENEGIQWLLEVLRTAAGAPISETSLKIIVSGSRALMRMCVDEKKIYTIMQAGGVNTLMSIIASHGQDEGVLVAALEALAKMVTRKENAEFLVKCGLLQAVNSGLVAHPESVAVALASADIFERLSKHPSTYDQMLAAGSIDRIAELLKKFPKNAEVVNACLRALKSLSTDPKMVKAMAKAGIPELVAAAMRANKENAELIKNGIRFFEAYAKDEFGAQVLRDLQIHKLIAEMIEANQDNAEIQALASSLMAVLAGANQYKTAVFEVKNNSAKVMEEGVFHAAKLAEAVTLLSNLTLVEGNHGSLLEHDATGALTAAVQAAMTLQPCVHRSQILQDATQGLFRLSENSSSEFASVMCNNGSLFALLDAIMKDPSDETLAENAMRMVAILAKDPNNYEMLIRGGVIGSTIAISKLFPFNEVIQSATSQTLGSLSMNAVAAKQIVDAGGAKVVVDALLSNIDNTAELLKNLAVIRKIAVDAESAKALVDAGALDAILQIFKKYQTDPLVVESCLHSLISLLVNEEIAVLMGEKGVFALSVPAIRSHYKKPTLVEADVVLLDSLASAQTNAGLLLDEDFATIELMQWVVRRFKDRPVTIAAAERLIATLTILEEQKREEALKSEIAKFSMDDASCAALIQDFLKSKNNPDELRQLFMKLDMLLENPEVIALLAKNGGPNAMSEVMTANRDNEEIFTAASNAFMKMTSFQDDDDLFELYEDGNLLAAQVEIFKPHPNFQNPIPLDQQAKALASIGNMKLTKEMIDELIRLGAIPAALKHFMEGRDPNLITQAAKLLGKMSNDDDAAQLLASGQFASIRELVDALRKNLNNVEFLRYGIYLLGNLAVSDALKDEIGIQSGVQLIIQAANQHSTEFALVKNCLYALATLTFSNQINCAFVMACRGIPMTIQFITSNLDNPDLLDPAICILCNMCHTSDSNKILIINEGGSQAIVDTILNNFDHIDVLLTAFKTLGILAYNAQSVDMIIKSGAVQGIVAGMTVLADNIEIVEVAISVLTSLASNCNEHHMKIMAEEGAVQAIVEVASQHTTNVDIELSSVTALCNLAVVHYNADAIIKQGGTEVVVSALKTLSYDAEFVETAIRLLFNLTYSINNLNRLIKCGVTKAVMNAMKTQAQSAGIVTIGLRTISNICYSDEVTLRIADDGPIEFIIALLETLSNNAALSSECLLCLSALSRPEPNALSMAVASTQRCVKLLQLHAADSILINAVSRFLANLYVHGPAAIAALETNIIKTIVNVISMHIGSPEVLLIAGKPLENMAYGGQNVRDILKEQLVVEKMNEAIDSNLDREDVRIACTSVINAVNRTDFVADQLEFIELNRTRRNIKDVYAVLGEKKEETLDTIQEIPPKIKNFLTAGALLIKHSRSANPRPRHLYVTDDLKWLVWKDPKSQTVDLDSRMKIFKIRTVERGRCTEQLQRKRFGKFNADEKCCFSIQGRERTVDVEAASEKDREKWVHAVETLIAYKRGMQALQNQSAKFD